MVKILAELVSAKERKGEKCRPDDRIHHIYTSLFQYRYECHKATHADQCDERKYNDLLVTRRVPRGAKEREEKLLVYLHEYIRYEKRQCKCDTEVQGTTTNPHKKSIQ